MSSTRERGTDPYDRFNDDPCRHKHGGTNTSRAAWEKARRGRIQSQQVILDVLRKVHPEGMTCKEIAGVLGKAMHKISGRITELLEEGLVRKSTETRDGGRVICLETAQSSSERDASVPGATRAHHKAEIIRLVDAEDYWGALRVAYQQNIGIKLLMPEVTV